MNHSRILLLFALFLLGLAACASSNRPDETVQVQPPAPTPTPAPTFTPTKPVTAVASPTATTVAKASLTGRVVDQDTNQPVAEALVSVGYFNAVTGSDGRYTLADLHPGRYVLVVNHPAYDPALSRLVTLAAGEEAAVDVPLYAPDTSPYPTDPMLTNPLDPNGAPTEEDAERLAREQGLTGEVVSIRETKLSGELLVNYKIGDDVRAAVTEVRHEAWELVDEAGREWWIIKVCGNLASRLPKQAPVATPAPKPLPPLAEVLVDGQAVRSCASEECDEVGVVGRGERVEVYGCLAPATGDWCEVGWSGGRGWCTGQSLRQLAVAEAVPVMEAEGQFESINNDHDWIAYLGLDWNIWLIDPATGELRQLTEAGEALSGPAWSSDGTKLAFGIGGWRQDNAPPDIKIIELTTENSKALGIYQHNGNAPPIALRELAWTVDGSNIYYSMTPDALWRYWQLRRVSLDGDHREETPSVSRNWFQEGYPAFSPDGRWMTYGMVQTRHLMDLPDKNWGIWIARADGQHPRQGIVGTTGKSAWSPDNTRVVYSGYYVNTKVQGIFIIDINTGDTIRLTDYGIEPSWASDGKQIVFAKPINNGDESEIWLMNSDGTNQRKLIDGRHPAWRPKR